jgi:hypothetical protein
MPGSRLRFRNIEANPDDPVESWPIEGIHTALSRGTLIDWRRIIDAVRRDPWGQVARDVEYVLSYDRPYGTAEAFERAIANLRSAAERRDKEEVAHRLATTLRQSGLTRRQFADRLGTSTSRLSTYLSGKVTPSAALLVRAERLAESSCDRDLS